MANRQKILRLPPVPPALDGPFAAPLFAPLSAPGTLCGCAGSFTSVSTVFYIDAIIKLQSCPFVKNYFPYIVEKSVGF